MPCTNRVEGHMRPSRPAPSRAENGGRVVAPRKRGSGPHHPLVFRPVTANPRSLALA